MQPVASMLSQRFVPHRSLSALTRRVLRLLRCTRGISTAEFALALPILLMLAFGLVEVGYMYFASASMDKAAQAGARVAVTGAGYDDGSRENLIENKVLATIDAFTGKGAVGLEISSFPQSNPSAMSGGAGGPCDIVQVAVQYTYSPLTPVVGTLIGPSITVRGVDRMVNEPWKVCE